MGAALTSNALAAFLSTVDLLAALGTRHQFGKSYISVGRIIIIAIIGFVTIGIYHELQTSSPAGDYLFLMVVLGVAVFQRVRTSINHRRGAMQHSQYSGYPLLLTLADHFGWISPDAYADRKKAEYLEFGFKAFGDPLLAYIVLGGITIGLIGSPILALWVSLSCAALFFHSLYEWINYRKAIRDKMDEMIMQGQRHMTEDMQRATEYMQDVVLDAMPEQEEAPESATPPPSAISRPAVAKNQPLMHANQGEGVATLDPQLAAMLDKEEE